MTPPPARTPDQRQHDTLHRLRHDVDAWVATADPGTGEPYMVPLSFLWDGHTLLLATAAASPTAANLQANGKARLGLGLTRDVVLIEGTVQTLRIAEISTEIGDAFAAKTGFDPRALRSPYLYFRVRPVLIQAWREVNELDGRDLMTDGRWHVEQAAPPRDESVS
ncbi:pyridoxamine 5'-phosphate oxidase family protein [Nonomuraea sp. SMC257]|uniref:Pyridoxamine 5'-phosphate oxidase family protein n=1 Tax=Nonomuraea montanisoli TaxID=2741721 RepID=A0A7Y6M2Z7_9ACTN|nr:pyridoxamine 5'-phosphate oxidase family protein [Nonomuraea montanisoli]NUW33198.1 pyridoxamine 5'-phosphate oxidase family protein [Nonomuraea montanisoli]